ncbi:hypothetical protein IFR04_004807 [Cadophora malorum]|uniref:Uncharacterized protein n=1 Tax=Cadophora malorum TaxID=108018 RepID=A0A8H7WC24_9HELO|nr:hypothetical protein IFR04_004807 [Cadophora malorum]
MDKSKPSPLAKKDLEDEQHDGGRLPPSSMPLRDSGGRDIDDYPLNDSQEDGSSPCLKETVIDEVAEDMVTEEPEEPQSRGVMTIVNNKRKWTWCSSQLKHLGTYLSSWLLHLSLSRVTGTTRENSTGIKTLRWRCSCGQIIEDSFCETTPGGFDQYLSALSQLSYCHQIEEVMSGSQGLFSSVRMNYPYYACLAKQRAGTIIHCLKPFNQKYFAPLLWIGIGFAATTMAMPFFPTNTQPLPTCSSSIVDILILGAGWTSTFLIPLLKSQSITYAATTTSGRDETLKFQFSLPKNHDQVPNLSQYDALPTAKTVLVTFPLRGAEETKFLVNSYLQTHPKSHSTAPSQSDKHQYQFIQLGSTGIWTIPDQPTWVTRHSAYNKSDARGQAEDALLALNGCVLNLAGLWGGQRNPKHWIDRVASTKELLSSKKSLHLVHGLDVARGILAVHGRWEGARGQRFMLTDLMVYDWWSLILGFAGEMDVENNKKNNDSERAQKQIKWIGELMAEQGVRALPRDMESLGRCYDTREFWNTFGIMPTRSRVSSWTVGGEY